MRNMQNYVQLTGRIFDLPTLRQLSDGSYILNLRITTGGALGPDGKQFEQVHSLVAWNQLAAQISQRFKRGSRIMIAGELRNRLIVKDNYRYCRTEIIVTEYQALKSRWEDNDSNSFLTPSPEDDHYQKNRK